MSILELLDKYTKTIKKLDYICNEIIILQKITNHRIKKESDEKKRKEIYSEFLTYIDKIKNNKELKEKYKKLKEKQKYLYNKIANIIKEYENNKKKELNKTQHNTHNMHNVHNIYHDHNTSDSSHEVKHSCPTETQSECFYQFTEESKNSDSDFMNKKPQHTHSSNPKTTKISNMLSNIINKYRNVTTESVDVKVQKHNQPIRKTSHRPENKCPPHKEIHKEIRKRSPLPKKVEYKRESYRKESHRRTSPKKVSNKSNNSNNYKDKERNEKKRSLINKLEQFVSDNQKNIFALSTSSDTYSHTGDRKQMDRLNDLMKRLNKK